MVSAAAGTDNCRRPKVNGRLFNSFNRPGHQYDLAPRFLFFESFLCKRRFNPAECIDPEILNSAKGFFHRPVPDPSPCFPSTDIYAAPFPILTAHYRKSFNRHCA